jgi:hypothetical protein
MPKYSSYWNWPTPLCEDRISTGGFDEVQDTEVMQCVHAIVSLSDQYKMLDGFSLDNMSTPPTTH